MDNVHAEFDAFVADKHGRTRNQLPDLVLALAAEGAVERIFRVATAGLSHRHSITGPGACRPGRPRRPAQTDGSRHESGSAPAARLVHTGSGHSSICARSGSTTG